MHETWFTETWWTDGFYNVSTNIEHLGRSAWMSGTNRMWHAWFGYVWLCFGEPELMVFMSSFVSRGKQCCAIGRPESACSVYRTKQMCTPPQAALRKHGKTGDGRVKPGSNHLKILKPRTSACSKPRIATETCEHCGSWILLQVAEICPKRVLISFFTYRHDQQD
jgi:hypothetical protein